MSFLFSKELNDPQNYYYYTNGFNSEELDKVYKDVATLDFEQATTIDSKSNGKEIRSSSVKWIPNTSQWSWLYFKLMDLAVQANNALWHFDLYSVQDLIQYTEYYATENGHYTWHQDFGPGNPSLRKISITVQLSGPDEYEGGDLEYWKGGNDIIKAPRDKGLVFIFPSYMMHRVTPVTKGIRRSFVLWVGGEHYK
jgi:PKHD-type hydroxylase